ncbi:MAG: chromosome segregation protein SMC, partial [Planctomycetota bacterium]
SDAVARIEKGLEGLAARKDRLAAEMLELGRAAEEAAAEAEALEKTIAGKAAELERLRSESSSLSDRVTAAERALRSLAAESSALEKRLDALRRDREDAKLALNSVEVRMAGLAESCMEALGIPLEQEAAERDVEQSEEELEKLVADSERKMKNLGNVNLEAVNLLEAVEERAAFLREQKRDLEASKRSLEEIIEDINRRCKSLFLDTFEKTRRNFNEIFRKLFGGGKADLSLEEGDVLEAGVNVVVRPPGKEPRQLSLLSGGEKALTALSLLLAMFRANPSPFCVLDEVDAPLDDTNVNRFVMLLREFSDRSQFILISHNKLTIEKADAVFGVTLDRDGVSRIVSVELERVASLLGDGD